MSLHHYLPATYLACFSADEATIPRRDRMLVVGDKQHMTTFRAPASRLAAEKNLYTIESETAYRDFVDATWAPYEGGLAEAISALVSGTITARAWTRILVPFAAAMLVRGVDFKHRFSSRLRDWPEEQRSNDNINYGRLLELQRILASVLAAEWHVFAADGPGDLILSDIGFVASGDRDGSLGIAIPLGPRHVLRIHPCQTRAILRYDGSEWIPLIKRTALSPYSHIQLGQVLASSAARFIYGSDEATVSSYLSTLPPDTVAKRFEERASDLWEPVELGFLDSTRARVHEFTWHRLVSMLEADDPRTASFHNLDFEVLQRGWCPPMYFPTNLPEFEPGLAVVGREILVHLYDVSQEEVDSEVDKMMGMPAAEAGEQSDG
ncbi:DUF4238 domain-containing protein (plasmid) [Sorangium sp. So ce119]|uniref:DUF4238 domain-containing protein n=1 Tax=Sorangium sp. So ce119 TaxID=3133279 RepID=UPI003F639A0D